MNMFDDTCPPVSAIIELTDDVTRTTYLLPHEWPYVLLWAMRMSGVYSQIPLRLTFHLNDCVVEMCYWEN